MLKLENLSWQDHNRKTIFDNLSFKFPEKGLIVITGDRIYQKALFNLLTYQKKPTSGCLWIGEKNNQSFTHSDIAFYYNFVLGIFSSEEFFLINDLDVKSNIKMYLEIQNQNVNTKKIKEILKTVDLLEEIELDSLVEELNNEQKQKLILAILMLKNCHIIVAFEPVQTSDIKTKKTFFTHFKKLSQTKLVIIFTNDINEINSLIEKQLIIQKNGFKINEMINCYNKNKTISLKNYFNFEETKQLYLKIPHHLSDELTELLSLFLFEFRSLPFKLQFLATFSLLRFHVPLISCFYNTLFTIATFFIIYFFYSPNIFFVCSLSLLILLVLLPVTFLFFSFWHRLEIRNMSVLNKKTFCNLQKIGINKSDLAKILQIDTYRSLELELTTETVLNLVLLPFFITILYITIENFWNEINPIFILLPLTLIFLLTPFIVVPLLIKHIVKKRIENDVYQKYYNYL